MASLASTLYAEFRSAQQDPTALPAYGNLDAEQRRVWDRVAAKAEEALAPLPVARIDFTKADPDRVAELAEEMKKAQAAHRLQLEFTTVPIGVPDLHGDIIEPEALDKARHEYAREPMIADPPRTSSNIAERVLHVGREKPQVMLVADQYFTVPDHSCKVCGATPDETGERRHGKGCYEISADGGGSDWP